MRFIILPLSAFISSQSFILAVGAIVLDKSTFILFAIATMSLIMIWVVWFPVVVSRHKIVDFYKYRALKPAEIPDCTEGEYVHDPVKRNQANNVFGVSTNWRKTRIKLDLVIPIMFTLVWLLLLGYALI